MKLDFEQTYLDIDDNVMRMTMKPSVESLETKQAFIQRNVPTELFNQLCFKAEVDIVRQWVVDSGFKLETHAYDFQKKEIVEIPITQIIQPVENNFIVDNISTKNSTKI